VLFRVLRAFVAIFSRISSVHQWPFFSNSSVHQWPFFSNSSVHYAEGITM